MTTLVQKIMDKRNESTNILPIKAQPFIYLLEDRIDENNNINHRYLTLTTKLMSIVQKNMKDMSTDDKIYYNTFIHGLLPEFLLPAVYIPFNQKNTKDNFNRLSFSNKLLDNYYLNLFNLAPTQASPIDSTKDTVNKLKRSLQLNLKDRLDSLNSHTKVYNCFSIKKLIIFSVIFWFIIFLFLLKTIHYYFYTSYNYIILTLVIVILLFAVVWKMIYTLY